MSSRTKLYASLAGALLLAAQLACNLPSSDGEEATLEALAIKVSLTATSAAAGQISPEEARLTAEAIATGEAQFAAETQAAREQLSAAQIAGTATAVAPILAELPQYGVDPESGQVAWIHAPVTLDVDEYLSSDFANDFMGITARDFVISADITWNTQYSTAGCGYILRSDGKEEESNQYMTVISRFGDGRVSFMTVANGELVDQDDTYVPFKDPDFNYPNDTTNTFTIVAEGKFFRIYSNGHLIDEVETGVPPQPPRYPTPPPTPENKALESAMNHYYQQLQKYEEEVEQAEANYRARLRAYQQYDTEFEKGFVAMAVLSESGHSICTFNNTWLFLINE